MQRRTIIQMASITAASAVRMFGANDQAFDPQTQRVLDAAPPRVVYSD
jgi:hypothetical protein